MFNFAVLTAIVTICVATGAFIPADAHADSTIPPWVKHIAVLWGDGQISDAEFLTALQYLVQIGLLVVPESATETVQESATETVQESATETVPDTVMPEPVPSTPAVLPSAVHPDAVQGVITRIIDGDTLVFDGDTYRLSLIDTPERGEDGYREATNALKALCPAGSTAYVEDDSIQGQDRYDRYLGVVWCEGNDYATTAGEYLSDNGYLKKFYTSFCGNTEAATAQWAETSGNWFYHDVCN